MSADRAAGPSGVYPSVHLPARPGRQLLATAGLRITGQAAGACTALAAVGLLAAAGAALLVSLPVPPLRRRVQRGAEAAVELLAALERRRLGHFLGEEVASGTAPLRVAAYLAVHGMTGLAFGLLLLCGVFLATMLIGGTVVGFATRDLETLYVDLPGISFFFDLRLLGLVGAAVMVAVIAAGSAAASALQRWIARRLVGGDRSDRLRSRITELAQSRAAVVGAIDEERRRIERDLHDGAQQRVVALAMMLGRARRAEGMPERSRALVERAHEESRRLVEELRDVAWRVYPRALDELGLGAALGGAVERAGLPVSVDDRMSGRAARAVETAAFFTAREAVTNAVKHSGADRVEVLLHGGADRPVSVAVADDGRGGADPAGGGLSGLRRRVESAEGRLTVDSPPGGPTVVAAVFPGGTGGADAEPGTAPR
ncbi:sensor histidine kinase [Nocardiopsis coralliicola]